MDQAAREYIRALEDRDSVRRQPPHDIFTLQDKVRDYARRVANSRNALGKAAAARYGPTRQYVTRPAAEGVYAAGDRLLVRRGADGPSSSFAFWNVQANASLYLQQDGKTWVIKYGPKAGSVVQLGEHWTPGGLRR
jgi:hypothetical protein